MKFLNSMTFQVFHDLYERSKFKITEHIPGLAYLYLSTKTSSSIRMNVLTASIQDCRGERSHINFSFLLNSQPIYPGFRYCCLSNCMHTVKSLIKTDTNRRFMQVFNIPEEN